MRGPSGVRITSTRRRAGDEAGVVLVLTAMLLVVLLGMTALAIDTGSFRQSEQRAQVAADAGALAGADDLPSYSSALAGDDASSYATADDDGATVSVTTPWDGNADDVAVAVTNTTPVMVGAVIDGGRPTVTVSAQAIAQGSIVEDGNFNTPNVCLDSGSSWGCNISSGGSIGPWTVVKNSYDHQSDTNVDAMECGWHQGGDSGDIQYITQPAGDICNATADQAQGQWFADQDSTWVVDLNGEWDGSNPPEGAIEQTLTTVAGDRYELSFALSDNPTLGPQPSPDTANQVGVTIIDATSGDSVVSSGATQTFTAPAETEPDPNPWVDETVPFTATSTSTTVTFTSEDANSCSTSNIDCPANAGPIITDVRTLSSLIR